jgi:hypothetical protein
VDGDYDRTDRNAAYARVRALRDQGVVATGLLHVSEGGTAAMHDAMGTTKEPLVSVPYERLCPGSGELSALMEEMK